MRRLDPVGELASDLQGLLAAAVLVHVEQAGQDLVQGVPGRPDGLLALHAIDELLGEGAQVARTELPLALGQPGDDPVAPSLKRVSPVLANMSAQAER